MDGGRGTEDIGGWEGVGVIAGGGKSVTVEGNGGSAAGSRARNSTTFIVSSTESVREGPEVGERGAWAGFFPLARELFLAVVFLGFFAGAGATATGSEGDGERARREPTGGSRGEDGAKSSSLMVAMRPSMDWMSGSSKKGGVPTGEEVGCDGDSGVKGSKGSVSAGTVSGGGAGNVKVTR
jgi:hypothetical protein